MKQRILLVDIETSPNIGYTWQKYETNVIEYTQDWYILCVAWKWLGEKKIYASAQIDNPSYQRNRTNDKNVLQALWDVLNEAEVVIVHNGASFDIPKINARFIYHGLTPPSPYKVVDTLRVARKYFQFDSNKLDDLGKYLDVGRKLKHEGFELWKKCMAGDEEAWKRMVRYNKQDVALLEEVYLKFRPWIENHPHSEITSEPENCPLCLSRKFHHRGFEFLANGRKRTKFQCQSCGHWFRGKIIKIEHGKCATV